MGSFFVPFFLTLGFFQLSHFHILKPMKTPVNNPIADQVVKEADTLLPFAVDSTQAGNTVVNEDSTRTENTFNEETVESLREYGEVLRSIHNRLLSEGYIFKDGRFYNRNDNI